MNSDWQKILPKKIFREAEASKKVDTRRIEMNHRLRNLACIRKTRKQQHSLGRGSKQDSKHTCDMQQITKRGDSLEKSGTKNADSIELRRKVNKGAICSQSTMRFTFGLQNQAYVLFCRIYIIIVNLLAFSPVSICLYMQKTQEAASSSTLSLSYQNQSVIS